MIDPLIERVIGLLTPKEWEALLWLMACTLAATQTLKVIWRLSPLRGGGHGGVNSIAAISGMASAIMVWPAGETAPWYVAGIIAGPASIVVFKIGFGLLNKFLPGVAATMNADRRKVETGPPPETIERRKTDD